VTSIHRFSGITDFGAGRFVIGSAAALIAITLAGCGGSTVPNSAGRPQPANRQGRTETPAPMAQPQTSQLTPSAGNGLVASVAAKLSANGVACSAFRATDRDPGAVAQGTCGFPNVIEIAAFPDHNAILQIFAPFLTSSFCSSSLTSLYVDAGTYAVYTIDDTTTDQIASILKLSPTKLC
jgi:hypothetical protein